MTEEIKEVEVEKVVPLTFAEKWHAEKMLKRSKKKARNQLMTQGYERGEATSLVKKAITRIASNKPAAKSAGRGR